MTGHIAILFLHDLAIAFKNKTFILLLCIPLFVYGLTTIADDKESSASVIALAVADKALPDPGILAALRSVPEVFSLRVLDSADEGRALLKNGEIDGFVTADLSNPGRVGLLVLKNDGAVPLAINHAFLNLQLASAGAGPGWISDITALQNVPAETQALPTWILMVVLLVALFVLPAQVAEEKEKHWLSGLLQTPMTGFEWIVAKLLFTSVLLFFGVILLQLLGGRFSLPWTYYFTLLLGGFCFNSIGLALGLSCRNQATARTFGVILYLPLLVPAALSDASARFMEIAKWSPSFALYGPLQSVILYPDASAVFPVSWLVLIGLGSAACAISFALIRIRHLMH